MTNGAHALAITRNILEPRPGAGIAAAADAPAEAGIRGGRVYGILPRDTRQPYTCELIARLFELGVRRGLKPRFGPTLVTGFARLFGYSNRRDRKRRACCSESALRRRAIGSAPCADSAHLPAEHHRLRGRPAVQARQHRQERQDGARGRQRRGAQAALVVGASHGAATTPCGRARSRHLCFMAQLAHLRHGRRAGGERSGPSAARRGEDAEERTAAAQAFKTDPGLFGEGRPYYSGARLWDDGILDPVGRAALGRAGGDGRRADPRDAYRRLPHVGGHACSRPCSSPTAARSPSA